MNIYRTTSRILVNGKDHMWFISNFLEDFFLNEIEKKMSYIQSINEKIIEENVIQETELPPLQSNDSNESPSSCVPVVLQPGT